MPGVCARCTKTVYFNEEKIAIGKSFHVSCFVCAHQACRRRLDSSNLTNHDGEIYCKSCYGKLFGPKGYGYGGGAGTLSMDTIDSKDGPPTSNIPATAQAFIAPKLSPPVKNGDQAKNGDHGTANGKPKWGGADICPRCGKTVYMAEKMMGGGSAWHKMTCFTCKECNKRLESTTLCEREGEIYCKTCYGRNWGPKGYGYGGGAQSVLQTS